MNADEVIKLLKENGWEFSRQSGSHKTYKKPGEQLIITVPDHGKKDLKPGTLNRILKNAGLK